MKKQVCCMMGVIAVAAILGLASRPVSVAAEEPNPKPGLNNVPVRLCIDSLNDADSRYCGPGEVIAEQVSITRDYQLYGGGQTTLPGTFQFVSSQLDQGGGNPRAVVFGPISGSYEGYSQAWLWGVLFRDGILGGGYHLTGFPTEVFRTNLGNPGAGLDLSFTAEFMLEYAFQPRAWFGNYPYYVALYLDQSPPGHPFPHPGFPVVSTLDGQVWGWDSAPPGNP